jgi:hypothetical protein
MFIEHLTVPNDFIEWLEKKESDTVVGKPGDPCNCPIANYLYESNVVPKGQQVSVGISRIGLRNPDGDLNGRLNYPETPPAWVTRFVLKVDAVEKGIVTAEKCLEVIEDADISNFRK